jgi:Tfp pilus assembly protein PilF
MTHAPVPLSLRNAPVLLVAALALFGCAVDPSTNPDGRVESDKSALAVHEKVEVDADTRSDYETAMRQLQAGEYEKGTDLLTKVSERAPGHTAPYINLAIAYQKMGKLPAAEESIKKALQRDPQDPLANTEYGLICRKTGRFAEARKAYEQTLERHPGFLPARKNLGILCDVFLRDMECALTHYRVYSAAMPDDKTVQIWIADLEKRLGRPSQQ